MKSISTIFFALTTMIVLPMQQLDANSSSDVMAFEILQFYAVPYSEGAVIIWKIQHDSDIETYFLQHSRNQLDWTVIEEFQSEMFGEIDANEYQHQNLEEGLHYYRLVLRTTSGQDITSKAIVFRVELETDSEGPVFGPVSTTVLPNAQPDIPEEGGIEVLDARGKVLIDRPDAIGIEHEIRALPPGTYYLRYTDSGLIRKIDTL